MKRYIFLDLTLQQVGTPEAEKRINRLAEKGWSVVCPLQTNEAGIVCLLLEKDEPVAIRMGTGPSVSHSEMEGTTVTFSRPDDSGDVDDEGPRLWLSRADADSPWHMVGGTDAEGDERAAE